MTHPLPIAATLARLALGRMRDATTLNAVIPAKAGIHWPLNVKMDPRFRGDDASVANRCNAARLALGRMRHLLTGDWGSISRAVTSFICCSVRMPLWPKRGMVVHAANASALKILP